MARERKVAGCGFVVVVLSVGFFFVVFLYVFAFSFLGLGQNPPALEGQVNPSGGWEDTGRSRRARCKTPAMIFSFFESQPCFDVS